MKHYTQQLGGAPVEIHVPEREEDIDAFAEWIETGSPDLLGFDTETTGLDMYSLGYELRLAQFGDHRTGWVLRVEQFAEVVKWALRSGHRFAVHNYAFDGLVVDRHLGVTVEELTPRIVDTKIMAHLVDPRQTAEGGIGTALKPLAQHYVDRLASDGQKELQAEFRAIGATKETGWAKIAIDNPAYELYAGLDPILSVRIHDSLKLALKDYGIDHLIEFEHELQRVLMLMQRRGIRIDVPWTESLRRELQDETLTNKAIASQYGVGNINSTKQLSEALLGMGETLTERTASGAWKVDKSVLQRLADVDANWKPLETRQVNRLAEAVLKAKRAEKWDTAYLGAFLDLRDADDRLHPMIGGLQARTGRMSISHPPLQQLPSSEWRIRRAMVADPGQVIIAADYSQVEMRVLAALCQDRNLVAAIHSGTDLHDYTARMLYGDDFTSKQRKIAKSVGFGKVYGGGAATITRQTGAPNEQVKEAIAAYDATFPGIKALGYKLQRQTQYGALPVVTPSGRRLPLDRDRTYAATNYLVQSTARDLLAQALVDMDAAGLSEHLLLPVHDEIIAQCPEADAEEVLRSIAECMDGDFMGIPIVSDPEKYGSSWGHGYGAED